MTGSWPRTAYAQSDRRQRPTSIRLLFSNFCGVIQSMPAQAPDMEQRAAPALAEALEAGAAAVESLTLAIERQRPYAG